MFGILNSRRNSQYILTERQPRKSDVTQGPKPLLSEDGTDESRYYRSAEFQQVLLEAQLQRNITQSLEPPKEEAARIPRYWQRKGSEASKRMSMLFDFQQESTKQEEACRSDEFDSPLPDFTGIGADDAAKNEIAKSTDGASSVYSTTPSQAGVQSEGISPLIDSARNGNRD